MDLRRPRPGEWIAALSGAALNVSLFLPWYRFEHSAESLLPGGALVAFVDDAESGWEAFAVTDLVLALAGLLGVASVVVAATQRTVAIPVAFSSITVLVGMIALFLVALRLLFEPAPQGAGELASSVDVRKAIGAWIALAGGVGLTAGAWMGMHDERIGEGSGPAEIVRRPAPRP